MSVEYPSITPEMLKEFEDQLSPKLRTPTENVRVRQWTAKKTQEVVIQHSFRESAVIEKVVVARNDSEAWGTHDVFKVTFGITSTKGSGLNVGKKVTLAARLLPSDSFASALDWQKRSTAQGLLLLTQVVRARGYEVAGGISSAQMKAYYPTEGDSPLVGAEVEIEVANKSNSDFSEVSNVFKLQTTAPDAEV